ncbi:MAG: TlpA disulfide reductase family protein [Cytophagaceae bacterium]
MRLNILFLLTVLLFSCSSETEKKTGNPNKVDYSIGGDIAGLNNGVVYLEEMRDQRWIIIDSAQAKDNRIELEGQVFEKDIYRLRTKSNQFVLIYIDGNPLTFKSNSSGLPDYMEVLDSEPNKILSSFNKSVVLYNQKHSRLEQKLDSIKEVDYRSKYADELLQDIKSLEAEFDVHLHTTIKQNVGSPVVFSFLSYLDWPNDLAFIEEVTNEIKKSQPDYKYTKLLVENLNQYKAYIEQKAAADQQNPGAIGKIAPDFALPDVNGKIIRLSSLRGKYVLVDMWASWCGPCRQEMPNVVNAYQRFKGKNFEILGVSLDNNKDNWLKAIKSDKMTWPQVSDLQMWQSSIVSLYKIEGIPATYLLNPEGIVIARDLRGNELEKKLEEVLSK